MMLLQEALEELNLMQGKEKRTVVVTEIKLGDRQRSA